MLRLLFSGQVHLRPMIGLSYGPNTAYVPIAGSCMVSGETLLLTINAIDFRLHILVSSA